MTQLGYTIGEDTTNASDTYHQKELGFSDAIRYQGKTDVTNTYVQTHDVNDSNDGPSIFAHHPHHSRHVHCQWGSLAGVTSLGSL